MLDFMDYVQQAFFSATHWNRDNSYGALTATARALLDFPTPTGLTLNLSSLPSPNFATSYSLANAGTVDGSLSYLYSSQPLHVPSASNTISLRHIIPGYRQLHPLRRPDEPSRWELWHGGQRTDRRATLLYGRLYLPASHLEALYLRRISPISQLKISAVSSSQLRSGGSVLVLLSQDHGKYSTEWLYSTDSALLGVRGLYNFGPDPRSGGSPSAAEPLDPSSGERSTKTIGLNGRFSAGAEVYYGLLNKSGGMSTGIRFATLPQHAGFPYTMTLTLNPLMGNLSSTYAVRAGRGLALCSRFDFNFYSYESEFKFGAEVWRRRMEGGGEGVEWARRRLELPGKAGWGEPLAVGAGVGEGRSGWDEDRDVFDGKEGRGGLDDGYVGGYRNEDTAGVLKTTVNQDGAVGLLWEGKAKELLYSCGVTVDFKRRDQMFRGVGLAIQYSS
ncbi:MAG: Mitochondrial distribution and morphology protein 10 [Stictis urceolatum]|nr:Mitochondrial distribution and morphology protein 10 [Stictis urceolata]